MNNLITGFLALVFSSPLLAAMTEDGAAPAPAETVDVIWVIGFAVLFFGMIGYFFWYLMQCEKRRKQDE